MKALMSPKFYRVAEDRSEPDGTLLRGAPLGPWRHLRFQAKKHLASVRGAHAGAFIEMRRIRLAAGGVKQC